MTYPYPRARAAGELARQSVPTRIAPYVRSLHPLLAHDCILGRREISWRRCGPPMVSVHHQNHADGTKAPCKRVRVVRRRHMSTGKHASWADGCAVHREASGDLLETSVDMRATWDG